MLKIELIKYEIISIKKEFSKNDSLIEINNWIQQYINDGWEVNQCIWNESR